VKITVEVEVSEEFLLDIICTAAEGGINYWAVEARNVKRGGRDGLDYLSFEVRPEEEKTWHLVNPAIIGQGIQLILSGKVKISSQIAGWIQQGVTEQDAGIIDADCADCIVQAGVFGEIVYG
jgi:hypothetical protein